MTARLIAIAGPLKASISELNGGPFSIGRETDNSLVVNDPSVSRWHCRVEPLGDRHELVDLSSHNKTFVNDQPADRHVLAHGDHVRVGDSVFVYLLNERPATRPSNEVRLDEGMLFTKSALKISIEDALNLVARDLSALMRVCLKINSIQGLEDLQREVLERVFEVAPAERAAILLTGEDAEEFEFMFGLERYDTGQRSVHVSRTVIRQVMGEGMALMSNDILDRKEYCAAQSLMSSRVRSVMCVPLSLHGQLMGVVYADSRNPETHFQHNHLQMMTALSNLAAGALANARRLDRLERENRRLQLTAGIEHEMVGNSQCMQEVYQFISKIAPTDITVLVTGETGTGKELAARAIHRNSSRRAKAFTAINCAALPDSLLESELFGHEKGAFTQAYARKHGLLEMADGGTVFLDEVGEMSSSAQAKLLRVLQEREFVRLGGTRPVKVDVRVIAATNKDLPQAIREGSFREDLYFRLNAFPLTLPPLRRRREDILLLAKHFAGRYAKRHGRDPLPFSPAARACLVGYDWPGNVRELANVVETAAALCASESITPDDFPRALTAGALNAPLGSASYKALMREAKRRVVLDALEAANGDHAAAAKLLGVHPNNLHRLLRNLEVRSR